MNSQSFYFYNFLNFFYLEIDVGGRLGAQPGLGEFFGFGLRS